jgi:peptide methionine sulfoxide reductase msrA/msrB
MKMLFLYASIVACSLVLAFWKGSELAANTESTSRMEKGKTMKKFDPKSFRKPSPEELRHRLTTQQFEVTQAEGTERPFANTYWDNKAEGIYVDIVSGEPLFSSLDKFESGTGWPSFTRPLEPGNIVTKIDQKLFGMPRTEVRSKHADSHLGHLFDDGPLPTRQRYCLNSSSLRFIPKEALAAEGYDEYEGLFSREISGRRETATLAGGCFWGMEDLIRRLPGVLDTSVGYTGGITENPGYEQVKTGKTGHAESLEIVFDPAKTSYEEILKFFFKMHDPTTRNQQGNDIGSQYRSAIFYHDEEQRRTAEAVKSLVEQSGVWKRPLVTEIVPAGKFYPAEDFHQDYLEKNPGGYTCHFVRKVEF